MNATALSFRRSPIAGRAPALAFRRSLRPDASPIEAAGGGGRLHCDPPSIEQTVSLKQLK
jgi:hypothetical protein